LKSGPIFVVSATSTGENMMTTSDETDSAPSAEVIQLRPAKAKKASERKWGRAVIDFGFCIIPSLLLRAQARLGLNPAQLAVVMHLADYWWEADRKPYPKMETLGDRLKLSPRQVRRYIAELETAGYVNRVPRTASRVQARPRLVDGESKARSNQPLPVLR
jgi:hypothetical protein